MNLRYRPDKGFQKEMNLFNGQYVDIMQQRLIRPKLSIMHWLHIIGEVASKSVRQALSILCCVSTRKRIQPSLTYSFNKYHLINIEFILDTRYVGEQNRQRQK